MKSKNRASSDAADPIELVRELNPIDETRIEGHDSPAARRLLGDILAQPRHSPAAPQRRRQILVWALVAAVVTAFAWALLRPITDPLGFACYAAPDLDADRVAIAADDALGPTACAPLWANRTLTNSRIVAPGGVPDLRACLSPGGGLAVFPTADDRICDRLGLAEPDPASIPAADAVRSLAESLSRRINATSCFSIDTAASMVRDALDDSGLADWTIATMPTTGERPCASVAIDSETRTVTLVPIPGEGDSS
ncbi:MAG: hypothetical protein ACR2NT_07775 [Acidimicrobiia bacterium]